jgi:hypothetical protein
MTEASTNINTDTLSSRENSFPNEIILSREIRDPLIASSSEVDAPDIIILPQRSAILTAEPMREFLKTHQDKITGDLPKIVESPIGKVIPALYIDHLVSEGMDEDVAEDLDIGTVLDEFNTWVVDPDNKTTGPIISDLKTAETEHSKKISHVLVLDDAVGQVVDSEAGTGETLTNTAPAILKAALGDNIRISSQAVLPDNAGSWEYAIVDENFPGLDSKATRFFMHELMKGTLDARTLKRECQFTPNKADFNWLTDTLDKKLTNQNSPILAISDHDTLRMLEILTWQFNQREERFSIVKELENKYGPENLLKVPELTKKAFASPASEITIS